MRATGQPPDLVIKLKPQQPPPPDYYAGNLRHLFGHVQAFYGDLLNAEEANYLQAFQSASVDEQRLYARLLGRKGPWIRTDKLDYREIVDLAAAVAGLERAGLVLVNDPAPADALLGLLTQAERRAAFPRVPALRKAEWINACVSRYTDAAVRRILQTEFRWIRLARPQLARLFQLLFFGDDHQDTSTFVLQDLGLMRFESYALEPAQRLFSDRPALERYRRLRRLDRLSHRIGEVPGLAVWLLEALNPAPHGRQEQRARDRTLNRLGRHFERAGAFDRALDCYGRSRMHPSRERRVRILKKLEDLSAAESLLAKIAVAPRCAEEVDFANRFGRRNRPDNYPLTEIPLNQPPSTGIEEHAAGLIGASGAAVFHLENALPRGLAGLAYWDLIFDQQAGAFANPFQTGPLDLFWPDFAQARAEALAERRAELAIPGRFRKALEETFRAKQGIANRLVSWRHFDEQVLELLLRCVPEGKLADMAAHVMRWPYRTRNGFPDLTVIYEPGNYEFVEVKGPTDQLQPGQRVWLTALAQMSIPARVLKFRAC